MKLPIRILRDGRKEWLKVDGIAVSDLFGVTRTVDLNFEPTRKWSVTHRPSGYCACSGTGRKREAIRLAKFLETKGRELGINWKLKTREGLMKQAGEAWAALGKALSEARRDLTAI